MFPLQKHLLERRRKAVKRNDDESVFQLQNKINTLICANQLNAVQNEKQKHKA